MILNQNFFIGFPYSLIKGFFNIYEAPVTASRNPMNHSALHFLFLGLISAHNGKVSESTKFYTIKNLISYPVVRETSKCLFVKFL